MDKSLHEKFNITSGNLLVFFRKNLFFIGCILFIILLPFETRYTNIAISIMALGWILDGNIKTKWNNLQLNYWGYWIFLFYAVCLVSILYSQNLEAALSKLETKISLVIMPLFVYSSSLSAEKISQLLRVFIMAMVFTSFYCLAWAGVNYAETGEVNLFFYQWLTTPTKLTAIYFANYLCLAVLIIVFAKAHEKTPGKWKFFLVSVLILFILMLAALSVTGYLICLGLLYGWFYFRRRFSFLKSIMMVSLWALLFFTTIWMLPYTNTKISKMTDLHYEMNYPDSMWNTLTIRLAKWEGATSVIKEHPFLGVGIGDEYDMLMESYARHDFSEGLRNTYNEHNQYLASLVATGLPGFLVLMAMLLIPISKAIKHQDYLLLAFIALMSFSFITENFLYIQKGVLFFSFFYALLIKRHSFLNTVTVEDDHSKWGR